MKLFEKVDEKQITAGAPPVVFYPAATGYIVFKTNAELMAWENDVRQRLGVELKGELGTASESCSAGCSDDCD